MSRARLLLSTACACVCLMASFAGCGGASSSGSSSSSSGATVAVSSSSLTGETVAKVGDYAITKAMLGQWMTELVGESYYEVATHQAPPRLVAEPADYPACVASLKKITPIPGRGRPQPQPTTAQLKGKCEELNDGIKENALALLVSSYWHISFETAHGIKISDQEVQLGLERLKKAQYPTEGQFQRLLVSRTRTLSQELFLLKVELLQRKLQEKLKNGGPQLIATFTRDAKGTAASADCRPGYIVERCKGYKAPLASSRPPPPSTILEEIARWRPETSHGFTGVPVT